MLDVSTEEITEGNLFRALLVLAVPLLAQNALLVVQQIVDVIFLGRLAADAVAAVGFTSPLVGLVSVVLFVTFVGTQVVVSRRVGGDNEAGARVALANGLGVSLLLGAIVGIVGFLAARPLLEALTSVRPGEQRGVIGFAVDYYSIYALGLPVLAFTDTLENGGFVAWGDSRASLYLNLVALATNVILDPLLIFGLGPFPRLAAGGAALATVLGSLSGALVGLAFVARGRNGGMLRRAAAKVDPAAVRDIISVGGPIGAQQGARQVIRLPIYLLVFIGGGAAGLAAYTIGARAATIAFVPPQGLQQAAQSVIGQNLGAGNADRAERTTWLAVGTAAGALALIAVGQWLIPGAIATAFAPTLSGDGFALTVDYLTILAYGYPALGAIYTFEAGFNAADRSRVSFASTLLQYAGVRLPIAAAGVLVFTTGVTAVFWAVTISNIAAAVWLAGYYRYCVAGGMMRRAADDGEARQEGTEGTAEAA